MSTALSLQIPDRIYKPLLKTAALIGKTPEQIVTECLEKMIGNWEDDPLLELAGAFESDIAKVSDSHDEFFGQSLRNDNE